MWNRKKTKPTKQDLYELRLQDDKHREEMFVDPAFFRTEIPLTELRDVCKQFNAVVERETGGIDYSVTLRFGMTKIAADFEYQFKRFLKYIRDNGLIYSSLIKEFKENRAYWLKKSIHWKNATGVFTLAKTIFKDTNDLIPTDFRLLLLYKAYSNTPNKQFVSIEGGVTGLSDERAAEHLDCSSKTIQRGREELVERGYITELSFNGRHRKLKVNI